MSSQLGYIMRIYFSEIIQCYVLERTLKIILTSKYLSGERTYIWLVLGARKIKDKVHSLKKKKKKKTFHVAYS